MKYRNVDNEKKICISKVACHNLLSMLIQLLHCPVRSQMSTAHPGRLNYLCRRLSQLMPGSCSPAPEVLCLTYTVLIFIIFFNRKDFRFSSLPKSLPHPVN